MSTGEENSAQGISEGLTHDLSDGKYLEVESNENAVNNSSHMGGSSLLERIRAKQQSQANGNATASNGSNNNTYAASPDIGGSFLPSPRVVNPNENPDMPKSIFPPRSSSLKHGAEAMAITETAPYSNVSRPPRQIQRPSTNYSTEIDSSDYSTSSNMPNMVFNSFKTGVSAVRNKFSTFSTSQNQNYSPHEYALLNEGYNEGIGDVEAFGYAEMDGNQRHVEMDGYEMEGEYSMKAYFLTFCRDIYGFTLARLPRNVRLVVSAILVVLFIWMIVDLL